MPTPATIKALIAILAEAEGLPPGLCERQCMAESAMRQEARSPVGAIGLFQLMPGTARELGVDPAAWHENVFGGIRYLGRLARSYHGDLAKALAAYNWGPGNMARTLRTYGEAWRAGLPAETKAYIRKVLTTEAPEAKPC